MLIDYADTQTLEEGQELEEWETAQQAQQEYDWWVVSTQVEKIEKEWEK